MNSASLSAPLLLLVGAFAPSLATAGREVSTSSTTATRTSTTPLVPPAPELTEQELRAIEESTLGEPPPASADSGVVQGLSRALQSMNPAMSFILDVAAGYFTIDTPDQRGAHDPSRTGFTFQQLELSVNANVDPFFRFDANLVFGEFGVEIEEAYASTLRLPGNFQLRAGQFLTRFGRINGTHPHQWSFMDQPLVNAKFFGGEGSRGLALEVSWLAPLPWYLELVASSGNPTGDCCARSFLGDAEIPLTGPEDLLYTLALEQFIPFDPSWSLSVGLSSQLGPNNTGPGNRSVIHGADLYLRYRPVDSTERAALSWQTEVMFRSRQVPGDLLQDLGLYSQLVWNLSLRWELGLRYEFVTGVAEDPLDLDWDAERQRYAAQVTFYPSHFSRVRAQVNHDYPRYAEAYWAFLVNLEVLVGAHGAHQF